MKKWLTDEKENVFNSPIFSVNKFKRHSGIDPKKQGDFYTIKASNWALVIPLYYKNDKLYMKLVKQYRHGSDELCVEFPSGKIEEGEDPRDAAIRELEEETGWSASYIEEIGSISPNPAIMENIAYIFIAKDLVQKNAQNLDELEEIEVLDLLEEDVVKRYMGSSDDAKNAMMMTALMFYLRAENKIK